MSRPVHNDPRWQEYSASLRKGQLYVKLPRSQASLVRVALLRVLLGLEGSDSERMQESREHLSSYTAWLTAEIEVVDAANQLSVVYSATLDCATKDAEHLERVKHLDESGILSHFHSCLHAGLRNDPGVDWISRVGGPRPDFTGLETRPPREVQIVDLADLFPDQ